MQTNKQTKCFINISRYRTNTISKRNMPTYNAATLIIVTLAKLCCCKSFCCALLLLTECANNYAVNKQSTCLCRSFCEQRAGSNKPATSSVPSRRSYRWAERNDRRDIGLHMSTRRNATGQSPLPLCESRSKRRYSLHILDTELRWKYWTTVARLTVNKRDAVQRRATWSVFMNWDTQFAHSVPAAAGLAADAATAVYDVLVTLTSGVINSVLLIPLVLKRNRIGSTHPLLFLYRSDKVCS